MDRFREAAVSIEELAREEGAPVAYAEGAWERKPTPRPRCTRCERLLPIGAENCSSCLPRGKIVLRMLGYVRPYLPLALLSFAAALLVSLVNLAPPMLMRLLTDGVLAASACSRWQRESSALWGVVGALFLQRLVSALLGGLHHWLNGYLGQRIISDVRTRLYEHLQTLSLGFYNRKSVGTLMANVTSDTSVLHQFCVEGLQNVLSTC